MSRWGELIRHSEDDDSCLCGCLDEPSIEDSSGDAAAWTPPVDEYRLPTRGPDVSDRQ